MFKAKIGSVFNFVFMFDVYLRVVIVCFVLYSVSILNNKKVVFSLGEIFILNCCNNYCSQKDKDINPEGVY